jgi:hemerythrin superfamily protein
LAENTDIFARLIEDHQLHRELFAQLGDAQGGDERTRLLERLTKELKGHAAAEEQALYSTMLRKPETTDETRHSVAEHKEIEDLLNDLAATDTSSDEWTTKFEHLRHRYTHHIDEEEEENFPDYSRYLDDADLTYMRSVFERRKRAEASQAEVTPEKLEEAQE